MESLATRSVLRGAAVLFVCAAMLMSLMPFSADADTETFPQFTYQRTVVGDDELSYDPTGEWVFASVVRASDYLDDPLGAYYLYTAPHDSPGGISLFYTDSLDGDWTEYEHNPVIEDRWEPHFNVSHVSSPHILWLADEDEFMLYFHGENSTTRFATSVDGVEFEYGGVAVTAQQAGSTVTEASYARVYDYEIPGRGNRYIMLFMDAVPGDGLAGRERRIRLAVSDDAREWDIDPEPLISPHPAEGTSIASPELFPWNGRTYVVYHASSGSMYLTDVGAALDQERHVGKLHAPLQGEPDDGRAASPTFVTEGDTMHMIYEAGRRSSTVIAHATADLNAPGVTPEPLPDPDLPPAEDEVPPDDDDEGPSETFADVSPSNPHYDDIHTLARNGLTNGCRHDGSIYCPDRAVTRAEMATFLTRAAELPQGSSATRFTDVSTTSSHAPGIDSIDQAGWTNGCGNGQYCPSRSVSRAEMATFIMRAADLRDDLTRTRFTDVASGSSHVPGIAALDDAGLTNGCGARIYCPDRDVTRAEMASFIVRAFSLT